MYEMQLKNPKPINTILFGVEPYCRHTAPHAVKRFRRVLRNIYNKSVFFILSTGKTVLQLDISSKLKRLVLKLDDEVNLFLFLEVTQVTSVPSVLGFSTRMV